jgi:hypothetical protein
MALLDLSFISDCLESAFLSRRPMPFLVLGSGCSVDRNAVNC